MASSRQLFERDGLISSARICPRQRQRKAIRRKFRQSLSLQLDAPSVVLLACVLRVTTEVVFETIPTLPVYILRESLEQP